MASARWWTSISGVGLVCERRPPLGQSSDSAGGTARSGGAFLAGISMLITQQGGVANAIWIMLVGWFLHSSAVASYQTNTLTAVLDGARVDELMVRRLGRIERESAEVESPNTLVGHGGRTTTLSRMMAVMSECWRWPGLQSSGFPAESEAGKSSLLDLIVPIERILSVDVKATAMDALRTFVDRNLQWAPVLRDREVVGVIRRLDLAEYVEKHRGA